MKSSICVFIVVVFCSLPNCHGQGTVRFTFDGTPLQLPGTQSGVTQYLEAGMLFRPLGSPSPGNQFARNGGGISFYPDNGTAYLQAALGESLQFNFTNGSLFGVVSVDLAEYSTVVPDARTVSFFGYRFDGSIVTTNFTTDGIIDGTGPTNDFQTFYFGPEFTNLTRVEIPTYGWSLDNLKIPAIIPTPSLNITRNITRSGSNAVISWIVSWVNFTLQEDFDFTTTNWVDVTNAPVVVSNWNQVVLPLSFTNNRFYRLKLVP